MTLSSSGWFNGDNFHLNRVSQVELPEDLCTAEERQAVVDANENTDPTRYGVICVHISDPRSGVDISINRETISLRDLNPTGTATSVLLTTFDLPLPDDVTWFKDKLCLNQNVEVTLCAHLWPGRQDDRRALWLELHRYFPTAALHFTGTPQFSQPRAGEDPEEPSDVTSVHAKLIILEFPDRLRVVITSANLLERFWDFNNEVLWVKDFPKGPDLTDLTNPAQGILTSDFGRVFCHFVVQILDQCPLQRQEVWLQRLLRFDLTCNVCLVASLPGGNVPKRALQPKQVALRLSWEETETDNQSVEDEESPTSPRDLVLKMMPHMEDTLSKGCRWCVVNSTESPIERRMFKSLDQRSSNALKCAEDWGFRVEETTELGESEIAIERSTLISTFRVVLEATDTKRLDVARMADANWKELADFLAMLEVDYGLFALRQHLGHEEWPQTQEEHYVAITGSIGGQDWWLQDLDECCGRFSTDPGPQVVLPCHRPRVPVEYRWFDETSPGKLVEHKSPPNAPGREKISNHGKLLARIFSDEGRKYGWIYVGSHNLTMSAWGSIQRPEYVEDEMEGVDEVLWSSNRELGVLLLQTPESESSLISSAPWPFGFPLIPKRVEDIDFESEDDTEEDWEEQWTGWNWSHWNADASNERDEWDEWDQEVWEERWHDWRLQQRHWWWWTP